MAKSGVSLHWGGLDKAMAKAAHKMANRQELMETVGDALVSSTWGRFDQGESPEGEKWEPSQRSVAVEDRVSEVKRDARGRILKGSGKKIKGRPGGKTLLDTGLLRKSIDYTATADAVMVGSNVKYARIHQLGGKAGRDHQLTLPARPFLGINADDGEEIQGILSDFLTEAFRMGK